LDLSLDEAHYYASSGAVQREIFSLIPVPVSTSLTRNPLRSDWF